MASRKIRNMEEFAEVSGISRPTVSKFFHDPDSVRKSTRARIEKALEQYDYRPNIFAINQNRKLTKSIGVVVPYLADPFFAEIARKIETRCIDAGFSPTLFSSHGSAGFEVEVLETLKSLKPAGALLAPVGRKSDRHAIEAFCEAVPTVLFDSNIEGLGTDFVGSDNHSFVSQSVDYLTRSGSAPVFFEMKTPPNPNANKRRHAYVSVMEGMGLKPDIIQVDGDGWNFEEIGYDGAMKVLKGDALSTDTVLCSNDRLAIGFLSAAYELGMRIGRSDDSHLRVASHDDHPFARFTNPSLTTVAHDYAAVSNRSVETLFKRIQGDNVAEARTETLFPARLILRASA